MEYICKDRIEAQRSGDPGASPTELLGHQGKVQRAPSAAAEFRGNAHVDQTHFARLVVYLDRETCFLVADGGDRQDFLAGKFLRRTLDQLLFVA